MTQTLWFRDLDDWAALLVPALILPSGFLFFVLLHGFRLTALEVQTALLLLAGLGLALGLLLSAFRSKIDRALALGVVLIVYLDVQYDLIRRIGGLADGETLPLPPPVVWAGALAGILGLLILIRRHLSTILLVIFGVMVVSTILIPPAPMPYGTKHSASVAPPPGDLATVVHVVLDGHIGIDGVPQDIEGGPELRRDLLAFYVGHGFRVYGRAYSEHMESILSISALLNQGDRQFSQWLTKLDADQYSLQRNDRFDALAAKGHAIRVYETDHLSYCDEQNPRMEYCHRVTASSVRPIGQIDLSPLEKAKLLLRAYVQNAKTYKPIAKLYDRIAGLDILALDPKVSRKRKFSTLDAPSVIDRLVSDIDAAAPGRAFFVHLLLPHEPYVLDADCQLQPDPGRWLGRRFDISLNGVGTEAYRRAAYALYVLQVRCVMASLSKVFEALKAAGLWDRATIILHGDHGSRIALRDPIIEGLGEMTPRDMVDIYSAFFAIRSPGVRAGYDTRAVSVQDLFAEYALERAPRVSDGIVYARGDFTAGPLVGIPMVPIGDDLELSPGSDN